MLAIGVAIDFQVGTKLCIHIVCHLQTFSYHLYADDLQIYTQDPVEWLSVSIARFQIWIHPEHFRINLTKHELTEKDNFLDLWPLHTYTNSAIRY